MTQVYAPLSLAAANAAMTNFLASVQSGVGTSGAQNALFANFLTQSKGADPSSAMPRLTAQDNAAPNGTTSSAEGPLPTNDNHYDTNSGGAGAEKASAPPAQETAARSDDSSSAPPSAQKPVTTGSGASEEKGQESDSASTSSLVTAKTDSADPAKKDAADKAALANGKAAIDAARAKEAKASPTKDATPEQAVATAAVTVKKVAAKDSSTTEAASTTADTQDTSTDSSLAAQIALMMFQQAPVTANPAVTAKTAVANEGGVGKSGALQSGDTQKTDGATLLETLPVAGLGLAFAAGTTAQGQSQATQESSVRLTPAKNGAADETRNASPTVDLATAFQNLFDVAKASSVLALNNAGVVTGSATEAASAQDGTGVTAALGRGTTAGGVALSSTSDASTAAALSNSTTKPVGSYDFASQLSATRATNGGTAGLPSPIEQIAVQLHKQVVDGNDQMTLQLRPEELGRIDIKLEFSSDNKVQGTVVVDNQTTLDLLSKDSGSLQRALQDAGLRADSGSLQFSLRDGGQQGSSSQGQGSGHPYSSASNVLPVTSGSLDEANSDSLYYITPGRVNVRV